MEALTYSLLLPSQSKLLCEGIARVYGDTYPIAEFYDPGYLRDAMQGGLLHSVVGMDAMGQVQACMSTLLESAGELTADGSALLVAPQCRGQGVVAQLGHHMGETYARLNLRGLHLYALALHAKVQNQSGAAGAEVTGILPAWFSRRARVAGYDYPDARIGAVCLLMPLGEFPRRRVFVPAVYREVLHHIYARLPLERDLLGDVSDSVPESKTVMDVTRVPQNLQCRLLLHSAGADFAIRLEAELAQSRQMGDEVCYLDVALNDPQVDQSVEAARSAGFFFGGLMVERSGTDRLRLQRYVETLAAPQHMVVASSEAQALLQYVLDDHVSAAAAGA